MGADPWPEATPCRVVTAWVDAFNAGDLRAIAALYHPQAVLWGTTSPELIDSPAGIGAYFTRVFAQRPAARMALVDNHQRRFGDACIASGRYDLTLAVDGVLQTLPARFSFSCVFGGDTWRIVDHHSSWVPVPLVAATTTNSAGTT